MIPASVDDHTEITLHVSAIDVLRVNAQFLVSQFIELLKVLQRLFEQPDIPQLGFTARGWHHVDSLACFKVSVQEGLHIVSQAEGPV